MDSFESQIRFGMTLSNLIHRENDTTLYGNRFLKNIIDRAQIETKKKTSTNRTSNTPINGKHINRICISQFSLDLFVQINQSTIVLIL
jgi:hypothetical protein